MKRRKQEAVRFKKHKHLLSGFLTVWFLKKLFISRQVHFLRAFKLLTFLVYVQEKNCVHNKATLTISYNSISSELFFLSNFFTHKHLKFLLLMYLFNSIKHSTFMVRRFIKLKNFFSRLSSRRRTPNLKTSFFSEDWSVDRYSGGMWQTVPLTAVVIWESWWSKSFAKPKSPTIVSQ